MVTVHAFVMGFLVGTLCFIGTRISVIEERKVRIVPDVRSGEWCMSIRSVDMVPPVVLSFPGALVHDKWWLTSNNTVVTELRGARLRRVTFKKPVDASVCFRGDIPLHEIPISWTMPFPCRTRGVVLIRIAMLSLLLLDRRLGLFIVPLFLVRADWSIFVEHCFVSVILISRPNQDAVIPPGFSSVEVAVPDVS